MKVVALVSGGKDSCFNLLRCLEEGHEVVCLANLFPPENVSEMDSYMYQSVGNEGIKVSDKIDWIFNKITYFQYLAEAMDLPLFREKICGKPKSIDFDYIYDTQDEVEDLYQLLKNVKQWNPEIEGKNDKEEFNFNILIRRLRWRYQQHISEESGGSGVPTAGPYSALLPLGT
jgi:diphthine-ammonia ligase